LFVETGTIITGRKEDEEAGTGSFIALQAMTDHEVRKVYCGYNCANSV